MALAIVTLLHILVFGYWLGGDVGAFYASTILTDTKQPPPARAAAAKVLNNVDMAPRSALILAFPTGFALAATKHWIAVPDWTITAVAAAGLAWLALAWTVHLRHAPTSLPRRLDLLIRWIALAGLLFIAATGKLGETPLMLFLRLKCAILAAAIGAGLLIRLTLAPFGPAFGKMITEGPTAETDAVIDRALAQSRPLVLTLWALLLAAAFLGLATPL